MMQLTMKYLTHLLKIFFLGLFLSFCMNNSIANNLGNGVWIANSNNSFIDTTANILAYDSNIYPFDSTSSGPWTVSFLTHKLCPKYYLPLIKLYVDKIWPDIQSSSGKYCYTLTVTNVVANATNYSVTVAKTSAGDSGGIAFSWMLYCYPPGVNIPAPLYNNNSNSNC